MSQVNEFAMNFITSPNPSAGIPAAAPGMSYVDLTPQDLPADVDSSSCDHISVSMDSAQITNYDMKSPTVLVDMVLSVSVNDPGNGSSKNYKIVKRISMDKCKLACDAEHLIPVQVVEEDDPLETAQIMEQFYTARRAREIAGITESAGTKAFTVFFKYDNEDGIASGSIVIGAVKDKAHARHVFDVKYSKNKKYPNVKIVRVTEQK